MNGITFHNTIKLALIEKDKGWIDSLQFTVSDSLIIEHAGYLTTKENGMINIEPMKLKELENLEFGREIERPKENPKNPGSILALASLIATGALTAILGFLWFRRRKANLGIIILLLSSGAAFSQGSLESKEDKTLTRLDEITIRKDKFGLEAIENRATDNKGNGDERFNGTRNFRVVLYDLVYRGGGNNLHLKDTIPKYYLWNPMPLYGLKQLQKIGFDKAVYLYSHNFDYWYPQTRLDSLAESGFDYLSEMKIEGDYKEEYFADVMARANDTTMGMMYMHCWNGWHQSGTIAAYTLMQFCDYSNSQALKYWERCTDGNYKGFKTVKSRIRSFRAIKGYSFTDKQKKKHCPCEDDIKSSSGSQSADDKINLTEDEMMQKNHSSSNKSYSNYKVKPGDNLGEIAERHGMRLSELKKLNHIRGTTIYAGQSLKVYDRKGYSKKKSGFTYSVKNGDTLSDIAVKYKTTVAKIKKANNLKSDNLQIGDKLKIP